MRLLVPLVLILFLPGTALADTPAQATAHAIDELANAIAQGKVTLTPTPTPTVTPSPTATPTPTPVPSATPEPTSTPEPSLPSVAFGFDPRLAGYVRPSNRLDTGWVELALPQGRWNVRLGGDCSGDDPLDGAWMDVTVYAVASNYVLLDRGYLTNDGDREGMWVCPVLVVSWQSDTPCAWDEEGFCLAAADPAGWPPADAQPPPVAVQTDPVEDQIPVQPPARPTPPPLRVAPVLQAPPPQPQIIYRDVYVTPPPLPTTPPDQVVSVFAWPTATTPPVATAVPPTPTEVPTAVPPPTPTVAPTAVAMPVVDELADASLPPPPLPQPSGPVWWVAALGQAANWIVTTMTFRVETPRPPIDLPFREILPVPPLAIVKSERSLSDLKVTD